MSNRYEITSLIEKDHLGQVFLAQDVTLQRKVVYRKFEADSKVEKTEKGLPEGFGQYTGKLCALQHPNLLTIYDIDQDEEGYFMVTQFIEAESLVDRLKQGPMAQVGVHNMVTDLLDAFHAVHDVGLFHGALRSDSVKRLARMRGGHRYLIVDLGLERISSELSGKNDVLGDTVLTAPELLDVTGGGQPDARSDLFALGQLCYICVAGGHPMSGSTPEECAQMYRNGGMPDLKEYAEGVQPDFADWIMSLVAGDPEQRPASVTDAIASLQQITLNAPAPNVAGLTQAVVEMVPRDLAQQAQIAQSLTVSTELEKSGLLSRFKRLPQKTQVVVGAGVAVLVFGLIFVLTSVFRGDAGTSAAGASSASHDGPVFLHPITKLSSLSGGTPYHVDLDASGTLDWTFCKGASFSDRVDHKNGTYITSVVSHGDYKEFQMPHTPLRFTGNAIASSPRGAMTDVGRGFAEFGDGWDVMLRVPKKHSGPLLVTFYLSQVGCDFSIDVKMPDSGELVHLKVNYAAVGGAPGVVQVPLEIIDPVPGKFYLIEILATSEDPTQEFAMALNAIHIQSR